MKKQATYVSEWDGGVRKESRCVVDTDTRTVEVLDTHDGDDVESLDREYVELDGEEYEVAIAEERGNFTAEQEAKMFFYEG